MKHNISRDYYGKILPTKNYFPTFKKEIISFFVRDMHAFELIFDLKLDIFAQDLREPDGFSKIRMKENKSFLVFKESSIPAIFKVRLYPVSKKTTSPELDNLFKYYRSCEDTFYSAVLNREFCIGDGDDTGAVTVFKDDDEVYVDIWVRSFVE